MNKIILAIDQLSKTVGHAFAWCIVILTLGTCYEVFVRYALNDPTSWAFDLSYLMYGAGFYMAGAYTLSRGGHVRADMFYRKWPERTQAVVELVLYVLFFFPGILALVIAGGNYVFESMRIREVSVNSPADEFQLTPRVPAETIAQLFGDDSIVTVGQSISMKDKLDQRYRQPYELFPWIMLLVLMLFVIENFFANRFYRTSQSGTDTGTMGA